MKIVAPPRQTPASIRSPGVPVSSTSVTSAWRLSSRRMPIIVWAWLGQSRPLHRCSWSNGTRVLGSESSQVKRTAGSS